MRKKRKRALHELIGVRGGPVLSNALGFRKGGKLSKLHALQTLRAARQIRASSLGFLSDFARPP